MMRPISSLPSPETHDPGSRLERVLLAIADDEERSALLTYLSRYGLACEAVGDLAGVQQSLSTSRFDLLVLDLALPGGRALRLCQQLACLQGPPVILWADPTPDCVDCIVALELGAAHFATRDRGWRELVARVRSTLLQTTRTPGQGAAQPPLVEGEAEPVVTAGPWRYHDRRSEIQGPNLQRVRLTPAEARLAAIFIRHPDQVLSRSRLSTLAGLPVDAQAARTIDTQIVRLRRKLAKLCPATELIETVHGRGYLFTPRGATSKRTAAIRRPPAGSTQRGAVDSSQPHARPLVA